MFQCSRDPESTITTLYDMNHEYVVVTYLVRAKSMKSDSGVGLPV